MSLRIAFPLFAAALWTTPVHASWGVVAVPPAAEDAASAEARASGASGDAAIPVCRRMASGLALCVRAPDSTKIAMRSQLAAANVSEAAVFAQVRDGVEAAWATTPAGTYSVDGVKGSYFVRAARDGFDSAGLLRPDLLASLAGNNPVVAIPEDGTLMWWVPGDADFDKMLAVGVKRMAEASAAPVSARVYQHNGTEWTVWGEVRGTIGLPAPAQPSP